MVKPEPQPEPEPEPSRTVLVVAEAYVAMRWPRAAPKTRDGITDSLATVLPVLTNDLPDRPAKEELRSALRKYLLLPADKRLEPTPEIVKAAQWLESASMPITDLNEAKVIRPALDALTMNMDGTGASANTVSRKRAVFHNFLEYLAERPRPTARCDVRVHVLRGHAPRRGGGAQEGGLLPTGDRLGLDHACKVPPEVNIRWTDSGETHGERGLKHRAADDVRVVPIPPVLAKIRQEDHP
ncbi:MAG: hypothetical protein JO345_32940 [Streptosporangiaceae bacterium]|nr:hypothetical protein [Streptosporangiaceae bacterium]